MSRYRDDTQETAVASSSTWLRLSAVAEEAAKITSTLIFSLLVLHTDMAAASDSVIDNARHLTVERATATDAVFDARRSAALIVERANARDATTGRLRVLHSDSATISDAVIDAQSAVIVERAQATDTVLATRHVRSLVSESARAADMALQAATDVVTDTATAQAVVLDRLKARVLVVDSAILTDEVIDTRQASAGVLVERATATDAVFGALRASDLVIEGAEIADAVIQDGAGGQAWTANVDTWAMSRYAPFSFTHVAAINGVLYGVALDGVYALNGGEEVIAGRIATGKVDIGKGALVHPTTAYLEYELEGTAEMDVITTQSGTAQTYTYTLPSETAGELTNGRFTFGRGLRGRHFSFVLRLTGTHGYINDLSVLATPTKRRV